MSGENDPNELAEAQRELEQLHAQYTQQTQQFHFVEQVLATLNMSFVITDMRQPGQPVIYVNNAFERLTGYSPSEVIGKNCRFLQNDDHNQPAIAEIRAALSSGHGCTSVIRNYRKDGMAFWNEVILSPIFDETGELTHFIGSQNDITRRKTAEETLQTTRDQLQAILDNSIAAIFLKDLSGCYIMANTRFYEMTGLSSGMGVEGKYDSDIYPPDRADAFRATDHKVLAENLEMEIEETFERDGQQITHLTVKFPLRDTEGQPYAIGGIATDISIRKQSEIELHEALKRQQELNELKTSFVSMASHEFRTPLATILATAETLLAYRHKMSEDEINRRLGKIQIQIDHLRSIMDDVLQLTRIQEGHTDFDPADVNFAEFCQSIVNEFQQQPNMQRQISYTCAVKPLSAHIDERLMHQVLSNLISNAVKYSSPGKTIWVDLTHDQNTLVLTVRDEGIGIPQEDYKHLFEPFYRATNVGAIPGTGLGLAIAMQGIELHGGTINVESREGVGTTFTIRIPQAG